jgi:pimeloyl-ACP methyl ester carboxylesterase
MVNQKLNFFRWKPDQGALDPHAPALVFLHGMGGTGQIWRSIAALLEDFFDCIAPDQRGHGKSRPVNPEESENFHAEDYAKDIQQLLSDLGIQRYLIIGHSMGVRTALALARMDSARVAGIIAIDIGITSSWGGGMGLPLAHFIEHLPKHFPNRSEMKDYLFRHCPDPAIAQYLSAVALKLSDQPESFGFPFDHEALIKTIHQAHEAPLQNWVFEILQHSIPIYFLRGANSKVWLKEDYENQKTTLLHPALHFEEWENCGHGLPFEQRTRFIGFVRKVAREL